MKYQLVFSDETVGIYNGDYSCSNQEYQKELEPTIKEFENQLKQLVSDQVEDKQLQERLLLNLKTIQSDFYEIIFSQTYYEEDKAFWLSLSQVLKQFQQIQSIKLVYTQNTDYRSVLKYCVDVFKNYHNLSSFILNECDAGIRKKDILNIIKIIKEKPLNILQIKIQKGEDLNSSIKILIDHVKSQRYLTRFTLQLVSTYDIEVDVLKDIKNLNQLSYLSLNLCHCFQKAHTIIGLFKELSQLTNLRTLSLDLWNNSLDLSEQNQVMRLINKNNSKLVDLQTIFGCYQQ